MKASEDGGGDGTPLGGGGTEAPAEGDSELLGVGEDT
ncbi:protein of unknown function [Candidatus Nitrotoga arctica]|uniref:Uncharacterized protein n=1 Tax=Candidatus Nitrotoga arctica TaxID=453162 RepID=A0ABM8ZF65_9PROT|nr:protein of unknown function [Candidatus Nitrotoga arctica]